MNARKYELICVSVLAAAAMLIPRVTAQQLAKGGRETAETMLQAIAADIKEHYYDPKFHGLDWDHYPIPSDKSLGYFRIVR